MADLDQDGKIFVGKSGKPEYLALHYGNRHGLVTGATGTGKTVTLQVLAEGFSRAGVSVFASDIKGDLSGLAVAFKAYRIALHGQPAPVIDGFTGEQRFFLGWGQVWRRKYRDPELLKRVKTDPHAPSEFRTNGPTSNIDAFYDAFGVKSGDRMYRPQNERVRIW